MVRKQVEEGVLRLKHCGQYLNLKLRRMNKITL
jgi:hypothetical protein